jgi:PhnB protein
MQVHPYLSFKGDCEAAFNLYARCLGGKVGELFRYAGSPMANEAPAHWGDKIMHGSVTVAGEVLMGADAVPAHYEEPKGFSMSIHLASTSDAGRIFRELAEGGKIVMPPEKTFWAERFGVLVDRFGITWSLNCDADQPS